MILSKYASIYLKIKAQSQGLPQEQPKLDLFEEQAKKMYPHKLEDFKALLKSKNYSNPNEAVNKMIFKMNPNFKNLSYQDKNEILNKLRESLKRGRSPSEKNKADDHPINLDLWKTLDNWKVTKRQGNKFDSYEEIIGFAANVKDLNSAKTWAEENGRSMTSVAFLSEALAKAEQGIYSKNGVFTRERVQNYIPHLREVGAWDPESKYYTNLKSKLDSELENEVNSTIDY